MDLEVVVPHVIGVESGEEGWFNTLNPEKSFALYAGSSYVSRQNFTFYLLSHGERRGARRMDLSYPTRNGIPSRCAQCDEP